MTLKLSGSMREIKPEVIIEDWQLQQEGSKRWLVGTFWHHYNQWCVPDGSRGTTSLVLDTAGSSWAETQNTIYTLGRRAQ